MASFGKALGSAGQGAAAGSAFGPWGAAIGGGIGLLSGLFGGGDPEQEAAARAYDAALKEIQGINVPHPENVDPTLQGSSAMVSNPAVLRALSGLQRETEQGGMTLEDRAAQMQAETSANRVAQARKAQIMNEMASRGGMNPGAAIALSEGAGSDAANTAAMAGTQNAANARLRALQAMMGGANIGERQASASDLINRYNTEAANTAKYYNVQNPMREYQMRLQKGQALMPAGGQSGGYHEGQGYNKDFQLGQGIYGAGQAARYFRDMGGGNVSAPGEDVQPSNYNFNNP